MWGLPLWIWVGFVMAAGEDNGVRRCGFLSLVMEGNAASASFVGTCMHGPLGSMYSIWQPCYGIRLWGSRSAQRSCGAILVTGYVSEKIFPPQHQDSPAFQVFTPGAKPTHPSVSSLASWPSASIRSWLFSAAKFWGSFLHSIVSGTILVLHPHLWSFSVEAPILKWVVSTCL